jgi:hypothetical protein
MNVNQWIYNPIGWVSMDTMSYGEWWIYTPSDPFEWNVVDLWNLWNPKIILNWLYRIYNWCHGFIIYMGHVHPIAQTHNSSMDVLHVSFRHDIFSYERKGSATYGNAKWELGSQLNKIFPSPRIFFNNIWIWGFWKFHLFQREKMWSIKLWNIHMLFYHLVRL